MMTYIRRFRWSNSPDKNKISWIALNKITDSKSHEGLGIRDLRAFNIALLAKQGWRLIHQPQSLFSRVFLVQIVSPH